MDVERSHLGRLGGALGSSSITTTADGTWNSEIRYSAFGETRYSSGITPTDYRYTGQLEQKDVNLYYYNARYYDAALGRFVRADTIVPNPASQKSYDRYTYVNNNPVRYTDPSGHCMAVDENGNLTDRCKNRWAEYDAAALKYYYGISYSSIDGVTPVSLSTRTNIALGAMYSGNKLKTYEDKTTWDAFKDYHGNIHIEIGTTKDFDGNCETVNGTISCKKDLTISNIVHEYGHVFDSNFGLRPHDLDGISVKTNTGSEMFDWVGTYADGYWIRSTKGFICDTSLCLEHPPSMDNNQTDGNAKSEQFADFYMNWILDGTNDPYHGFSNDSYGAARRKYFSEQQIPWVLNVQGE